MTARSGAQLTFWGGTRTVTGSMHHLRLNGGSLLLDCGLFQGRRDEAYERNRVLPFAPAAIQHVLLSHAHIDHSGNLPTLVARGFAGRIHATAATRDLCALMLPDSGHIQEEDVRFVNKINQKAGRPPRQPLYTRRQAEACLPCFESHAYLEPFVPLEGVQCRFVDAGHVLGSALTVVDLPGADGRPRRLAYAVDLGRARLPLLRDPMLPTDVDYLMLESTYGGRLHDDIGAAQDRLRDVIARTAARAGRVIIPSFALERTQEVVFYLDRLVRSGQLPHLPVYVDSPLAADITEVFRRHSALLDEETRGRVDGGHGDPFGVGLVEYVREPERSRALNERPGPMVIIAASGMCESGRVLHHLRHAVGDRRNTVLIVGFMADHTLGRRLVEREPTVRIFGEEFPLRAEVAVLNALSAHADQRGLLDCVRAASGHLKHIFLVHGEESQALALKRHIDGTGVPCTIPARGETAVLT